MNTYHVSEPVLVERYEGFLVYRRDHTNVIYGTTERRSEFATVVDEPGATAPEECGHEWLYSTLEKAHEAISKRLEAGYALFHKPLD